MNTKKAELISALKEIYGGKITDDVLVGAYGTAALLRGDYSFQRYSQFLRFGNGDYPIMPGLVENAAFENVMERFGSLSVLEFYMGIVPDDVADIEALQRHLSKYPQEDWETVKNVKLCNAVKVKSEHRELDGSEYAAYCRMAGSTLKVSHREFTELYTAVNTFAAMRECCSKQTYDLLDVFVKLSQEGVEPDQILQMISQVSDHITPQIKAYRPKTDTETFVRSFNAALQEIYHTPSFMQALEAIYILKNQQNDICIEDRYLFRKILAEADPWGSEKELLVIGASPFLVHKMINSVWLKNVKKVFVIESAEEIGIMAREFYRNKNVVFYHKQESFPKEINGAAFIEATRMGHDELINTAKEVNQTGADTICIFGKSADLNTINKKGLLEELVQRHMKITDIELLPSGIRRTSIPRKKYLLAVRVACDSEKIDIRKIKYGDEDEFKNQMLIRQKLVVPVSYEECRNLGLSLSDFYRAGEIKHCSKGEQKRGLPVELHFSREISIWITQSDQADGMVTTLAAVHEPPEDETAASFRRRKVKRGQKLTGTAKRKISITNAEGISWALNDYPYTAITRRSKGKKDSIRAIIRQKYGDILSKPGTSIKTLLFLDTGFEELLNKKEQALLRNLVNKTDLGNLSIEELTPEIVEIIGESIDQTAGERQVSVCLLDNFLDRCMENGLCQKNPLAESKETALKTRDKLFAQVRDALGVRFLYSVKLRELYHLILAGIKRGNKAEIGALIQLMLGLESNIVCALCWGDFQETGIIVNNRRVWMIDVKRQVTNDGKERRPFRRESGYRKRVCPEILTEVLLKEKDRLLAKGETEESLKRKAIVTGKDMRPESGILTFQPRLLSAVIKELIGRLNIPDVIVEVPFYGKGVVENNLSSVRGEILKTNFEHYMRTVVKMESEELRYMMGTDRKTTLGNHYIDYGNQILLARRYVELMKWEEIFK